MEAQAAIAIVIWTRWRNETIKNIFAPDSVHQCEATTKEAMIKTADVMDDAMAELRDRPATIASGIKPGTDTENVISRKAIRCISNIRVRYGPNFPISYRASSSFLTSSNTLVPGNSNRHLSP